MLRHPSVLVLVAALSAGCAGGAGSGPGQRLQVSVAPLTLTGVTGATYDLTVYNSDIAGLPAADIVWSATGITSGQYGDGKGAITYIGPCDASTPAGAPNINTVALVTTGFTSTDPADTFQLPCPANRPCRLERACEENADVSVVFNLTVMRNAKQGFFDIAVNFEDLFCSAKVDCRPTGLLYDADQTREATVVYALACTAGPGAAGGSTLLFDDLTLSCDNAAGNATVSTQPTRDGNQMTALDAQNPETTVFQVGIYQGAELLPCGVGAGDAPVSCQKIYSNTAVGIGAAVLGTRCTLTTRATAAAGSAGLTTPGYASYPIIEVSVPITDASGALSCGANPLNAGDAQAGTGCFATPPTGVCTGYTDPSTPTGETFAHSYKGPGGTVPVGDGSSACAYPESEHPNYTTPSRNVALCGATYDSTNIEEACAAGWHVCTLPEWQARYPAGQYPGGTVSTSGADQLVRCQADQWEANRPYDNALWEESVCVDDVGVEDAAYLPWNNTKNLFAADGATILTGSGNCCSWDVTFTPTPPTEEGFAVYCCID
ncbi:MAG: hypothetical protein JNJ59_17270 [Deltaproteobacteria bacterium]|nr:hypothetical protein [Deltaproteobacteria bacterium]